MSEFSYETDVTVRFRDMDVMGQVHNAVILGYVEEARVGYFADVLGVDITETDGAIARQEIDYRAVIAPDADVTVRYRVAELGSTSITMAFEVVADGETAAGGEVVHVVLDDDGEPSPVPEPWAEKIREYEAGPVES
jgi:acyl-CoA thioester hydrolase